MGSLEAACWSHVEGFMHGGTASGSTASRPTYTPDGLLSDGDEIVRERRGQARDDTTCEAHCSRERRQNHHHSDGYQLSGPGCASSVTTSKKSFDTGDISRKMNDSNFRTLLRCATNHRRLQSTQIQ